MRVTELMSLNQSMMPTDFLKVQNLKVGVKKMSEMQINKKL